MSRKPIDQMSEQEMRDHLTEQSKAVKKRGEAYRKKQLKEGKVRFSCFVPKALKAEVEQAVKQIVERHVSTRSLSMHATEIDQASVAS